MDEEIKQKVCDQLDSARSHLRAAQRIAKTDPGTSKHLIRAIVRMIEDCEYECRRVME